MIVLVVSVVALGASLPAGAALGVLAVGGGVVLVRGDARGRGGTLLGLRWRRASPATRSSTTRAWTTPPRSRTSSS